MLRYSVLSILHHAEIRQPNHCNQASQYEQWINELNFKGITFPFNIGVSPFIGYPLKLLDSNS